MEKEIQPQSQTLYCVICSSPIPPGRDQRPTATCKEECKDRLDYIRALQRSARKCSHCLHPSTPEEREEFRAWRASRGQIKREFAPRDHTLAPKKQLRDALRLAVGFLQAQMDTLIAAADDDVKKSLAERSTITRHSPYIERLAFWLPRFKELVDKGDESARLIGEPLTPSNEENHDVALG